jgi:hypothetical protein
MKLTEEEKKGGFKKEDSFSYEKLRDYWFYVQKESELENENNSGQKKEQCKSIEEVNAIIERLKELLR